MDAIDGKIARLKNIKTAYGAWFDIAVDRINVFLVSTALAIHNSNVDPYFPSLLVNSIFIFVFMFGFESRYVIQLHQMKRTQEDSSVKEVDEMRIGVSRYLSAEEIEEGITASYKKWCIRKGLIFQPISLVEVLLGTFIVAPLISMWKVAVVLALVFLLTRVAAQQRHWLGSSAR
jgi:phosphatidylglycerophosphate synthase